MVATISGHANLWRSLVTRTGARLKRYNFTVYVTIALVALFVILSWATYDFYYAVRHKDEQLQYAGLRSQVVDFLLATTREPDGSSLLDNPDDFALARRPLKVVSVRKPFFGYFLTKGNLRSFRTDLVRPEPPRACILEYPVDLDEVSQRTPKSVQVCFAAVQNDPAGRYLYATIKYPSAKVTLHRRGQPLKGSDLIRLRLQFAKIAPTILRLALEAPNLPVSAKGRNPARFEGLYEVAGFLNDNGSQPTTLVSGQAIERVDQPDGARFVTLTVRIDASVLNPRSEVWPDAAVKGMAIGLEIRRMDATPIVITETQRGAALVSLAQAYLTAVPSGAILDLLNERNPQQIYWTSKSLEPSGLQVSPGVMQRFGGWIAGRLKGETIRVSQSIQSPVIGPLAAQLSSSGNVIPELAARVLALLTIAAVIVLLLAALIFYVARTIGKITTDAMALAKRRHGDAGPKYKYQRDQVGTIGRVITFLDRRIRAEVATKLKTIARKEDVVSQHQQSLRLIAHEIRSPVATLLELNPHEGETRRQLECMQRAMNIFTFMRDVESTKSTAQNAVHDLAASLSAYASKTSDDLRLTYEGLPSGALAMYDDILLYQVLQNVVENAQRFATPGTDIELRLSEKGNRHGVWLEIFNQGPPASDTEKIFLCGETTSESPKNFGIGLYAARQYVTSFGASIHAENRSNGFAIVVNFQQA